ncbi:SpaH/EbpB family LPXTG-anchored major pilin [Faecalibacterium sp. BIOML-A3]|uniref:SpaH/EbpB family LPXTG-anchored major pilin n=1 Tax=unclassified Faecalibacterium TaxID=2646395 RepID=UPI0012B020A1|nr:MULTISPECIES: SpaH/EbpB family LPXTG-anchored major pilin [unclassified Faecalibacterium]MSD30960.1 SpaH/EbpB family LPXTG-anchored major pilin [Faecalibacterium sp. BIOML-A4]MSD49396.1 SpaH/EbpB family LPXTG-anchored major pilin [Faecalibacterium sp. BIOML-A3]
MMKKVIKKLLAALLAVAMVCAMAIPAFAGNYWETEEDLGQNHCYDAFQIFTGDVSDDNTISNVGWGSSIAHPNEFLAQLTEDLTIGDKFETSFTPQEAAAVISQWSDSDNNSIAFARCVCNYVYSDGDSTPVLQGGHTNGFKLEEAGYYLIVDTSSFSSDANNDSYHAYNSFLLKVNKDHYHVQITPKVVKPTVEKKVYDNDDGSSSGDNNGWGSSADHAINEEFKFRLIAKLPASEGRAYDYYNKYTVCFNDTLSNGISFDKLDTVEITNGDGGASQVIDAANYTLTPNDPQSFFKLSIDNVKTCVPGLNLNDGATITVTYTAHLNENAAVNGSAENKNSVRLQYSNNPRPDGEYWGYTPNYTPESEVYVYTYQLNNTKYHDDDTPGNELAGAGFKLYSDADCKNEVKLYQDGEFYYPIKNATGKEAVEMKSAANGQFNVKGLDAGTYYLRETTTPEGYSTCTDTPIVISATHDGNRVNLDSSKLSTTIINKKAGGITLPSTGGIGTTIFYVVGGGLMVAAIVLLVTKKRMENK